MALNGQTEARKLRSRLSHPVVDADGHWLEYLPVMREQFKKIAGDAAVEGLALASSRIPNALKLSLAERRRKRVGMEGFWSSPSENVLDRATAMFPRLFYERLDDLGIDFSVVYPTAGLSFHNGARSLLLRNSPSNFCFNHIGHFASAGHAVCKGLFFGGVTRRFPDLNFAFLEGGVGWACMLYADLVGHWEKRNGEAIKSTHPSKLDRARLLEFARKYGREEVAEAVGRGDGLDETHAMTGGVEDVDDYFRCKIEAKQDLKSLFVPRFYFGCEADDPVNAWAFNKKANPMGARLNAIFSSDIGHFDVPDMAEVVPEAYELVEHGLIDDHDFKDFMFTNAVRFWGEVNPDFFRGTVVDKQAGEVLRNGA